MIDNFEKIKSLLSFESDDDFYHAQVIKRRKENPGLRSNSYNVKHYFIKSVAELEELEGEMKALCEHLNARACINLNKRSFKACAFHTLRKITDQIFNNDFKGVRKSYTSICGAISSATEKRWIIDVDAKDNDALKNILYFVVSASIIETESTTPTEINLNFENIITIENFLVEIIETKSGFHLIVKPFNTQSFRREFPGIEIHKDNPTILFVN